MRTRPGPKQGLQKGANLLGGSDEQVLQRKESVFDALRKLTSGPAADDWPIRGRTPGQHEQAAKREPSPAIRNEVKPEN